MIVMMDATNAPDETGLGLLSAVVQSCSAMEDDTLTPLRQKAIMWVTIWPPRMPRMKWDGRDICDFTNSPSEEGIHSPTLKRIGKTAVKDAKDSARYVYWSTNYR